ncbi:hypothetical protein QTP88_015826 [Uroleucon formosanum]
MRWRARDAQEEKRRRMTMTSGGGGSGGGAGGGGRISRILNAPDRWMATRSDSVGFHRARSVPPPSSLIISRHIPRPSLSRVVSDLRVTTDNCVPVVFRPSFTYAITRPPPISPSTQGYTGDHLGDSVTTPQRPYRGNDTSASPLYHQPLPTTHQRPDDDDKNDPG